MQNKLTQQITKKDKGFSLIEMMIVIAIIMIMAAIATPAILSWLPNKRLKAAARDIYSTMQRDKVEAVQRNTCVSTTFTIVTWPSTGGNYATFVDSGTGAGGIRCNGIQDGSETTLSTSVITPKDVSLVTANNIGGFQTVCFNEKSLVCGSQSGDIVLRNTQAAWYRIRVQAAGVIMMQTSGNGINWN